MRKNIWIFLSLFLFGCATAAGSAATDLPDPTPSATPTGAPLPVATPEPAATDLPDPTPEATPQLADAETQDRQVNVPQEVPAVDVSKHSVPLQDVYFDTFQPANRAVPLDQATPDLIARLRDAIPPIHNPQYESPAKATWLRDHDQVLGYAVGDQAWAYPIRILNFHEIVNDRLAGEPVLISYCPLCASGIVFSRQLGDRVLTFGNTSALYESDMVMLDYDSGSYWWQVAGDAIIGPLTGERLTVLPSLVTTWSQWQELHPQTLVLARPTNRPASAYDRDPFLGFDAALNDGRFPFPVSKAVRDGRLQAGTKVLAVQVGAEVRGYPLTSAEPAVIMDTVADQTLVVFIDPDGPTGAVFQPEASGQALTFELRDGAIVDQQTGSVWNLAGQAIGGPLEGEQLRPVPSRTTFWFAIVAAEPEITLYQDADG